VLAEGDKALLFTQYTGFADLLLPHPCRPGSARTCCTYTVRRPRSGATIWCRPSSPRTGW
jgi:hypothetical protein